MAEKNILVDGIEVNYEGLFDLQGLLRKFDELIKEKGYAKVEKERSQRVTPNGKEFFIELRPGKVPHPYHMIFMKIKMYCTEIEEVDAKIAGKPKRLEKGKVTILMDAWEMTDYENRWEQTPWYTVWSQVVDKIFYKYMNRFQGPVIGDVHYIRDNLQAYLDLHRYLIED